MPATLKHPVWTAVHQLAANLGVNLVMVAYKQSSSFWRCGHWTSILLFAWHAVQAASWWPSFSIGTSKVFRHGICWIESFVCQAASQVWRAENLVWNGKASIKSSVTAKRWQIFFEFLWSGNGMWVCHSWQQEVSYGARWVTNSGKSFTEVNTKGWQKWWLTLSLQVVLILYYYCFFFCQITIASFSQGYLRGVKKTKNNFSLMVKPY